MQNISNERHSTKTTPLKTIKKGLKSTDIETRHYTLLHMCNNLHPYISGESSSEALPENNLGAIFLVFLLADPGRGKGRQVGQHCTSTPYREISVLRACHPHTLPQVCRHHGSNFTLKPLRQASQQGISTFTGEINTFRHWQMSGQVFSN